MGAHSHLRPQPLHKIMDPLLLERQNICSISRELLEPDLILGHSHLSMLKAHKLIPMVVFESPENKSTYESLLNSA